MIMRYFDRYSLFAATLVFSEYISVDYYVLFPYYLEEPSKGFYQTCKKCKYIDPHNKIKAKFKLNIIWGILYFYSC